MVIALFRSMQDVDGVFLIEGYAMRSGGLKTLSSSLTVANSSSKWDRFV